MDPTDLTIWLTALFGGFGIMMAVVSCAIVTVCVLVPFGFIGWYIVKRSDQAGAARTAALSWPSTTGKVVKSRVEVSSSGESTNVDPHVIYEYTVNGQVYRGDQIRAGDKFMRVQVGKAAYETVDRYPEGATVTVFYNPAKPSEAALER